MKERAPMKQHYSVRETAGLIGKSERSVLLYVKQGRLKAERKGKIWLINAKSLASFAMKENIPVPDPRRDEVEESQSAEEKKPHSFKQLNAYRKIFPVALSILKAYQPPALKKSCPIHERIIESAFSAMENLACGYNAYRVASKIAFYSATRENICRCAALLHMASELYGDSEAKKLSSSLEEEPLKAATSLIRSMERKNKKQDA